MLLLLYFGADTKSMRTRDSINIYNYIYTNFEYVNIAHYLNQSFEKYKKYYMSNICLNKTSTVPIIKLSMPESCDFPLQTNTSNLLSTKFYTLNSLSADVTQNAKIGIMNVYYDNKILCSLDILLENKLKRNSWLYYFEKIFREFNYAFMN